ncbi:VOC family protein [Rhizobium tubonense]|uniref:Lactoylglutathione lyase n=1 Tax=Rhizobium tubonense TaxID=484088 RepID=A0A2W4CEN0_9HYPH|nr:VOC family protein [Rhizobium tubonense]PZM11271.1 lactoylglutathione lyase [Rhizobium tubonense]
MLAIHPVDHLVLPTVNIDLARERLGKLGFAVAPDARHPFGTENACIFFADGTYLEPLGVASLEECEKTAREGNVFTARDQAFRFRVGEDGFSAVVFGANDAKADDARFRQNTISAGKMLQFARPMRMPDGSESTAGFNLAFAADLRAPDFFAFCCERTNPLPADRGALEHHANGVVGMAEVVLSTSRPAAFRSFFELVSNGAEIVEGSFGINVKTPNVCIAVINSQGMQAFFDLDVSREDAGLHAKAIVFKTSDLSVTTSHLTANGVTYTRKSNRVLVKAAPGQGALFAFEEIS